jgi:hypothetical protein
MKILVACEESQEVCKAFRALGHEAYSCDLKPCSGGHPEWHIQGDALEVIMHPHRYGKSSTQYINLTGEGWKWDRIIAFPECTHLAVSGARHFAEKRKDGRQRAAIEFFLKIWNAPCDHIAIENPVGILSGDRAYLQEHFPDLYEQAKILPEPQCVQPYHGHDASKKTCLWLKGLSPLKIDPAQYVKPRMVDGKPRWANQTGSGQNKLGPSDHRAADRAKTYPGIAQAMAAGWGNL